MWQKFLCVTHFAENKMYRNCFLSEIEWKFTKKIGDIFSNDKDLILYTRKCFSQSINLKQVKGFFFSFFPGSLCPMCCCASDPKSWIQVSNPHGPFYFSRSNHMELLYNYYIFYSYFHFIFGCHCMLVDIRTTCGDQICFVSVGISGTHQRSLGLAANILTHWDM